MISAWAPILFAPTLLVGTVYGMNFNHMPELHWLLGYPLALLLMLVSSVSLHAKEASSFPDQKRDRAAPSRSGLYQRGSVAGCAGQRARHSSTSEPGRRRRRQRQPRASLERTPSAGRQPGFPAPRRRPEPPAREQGLERWVRRLRRPATRSAVWGKEPTGKTRQTRTVRLPLKPLPSA
jgi:CorA-like Mg2+ transporter protein